MSTPACASCQRLLPPDPEVAGDTRYCDQVCATIGDIIPSEDPKWGAHGTHCVVCALPLATSADQPETRALCDANITGHCHAEAETDLLAIMMRLRVALETATATGRVAA